MNKKALPELQEINNGFKKKKKNFYYFSNFLPKLAATENLSSLTTPKGTSKTAVLQNLF